MRRSPIQSRIAAVLVGSTVAIAGAGLGVSAPVRPESGEAHAEAPASVVQGGATIVGPNNCTNGDCHVNENDWWKRLDGSSAGLKHEQAIRRMNPNTERDAGAWASAMGQSAPAAPDGVCVNCHVTLVGGRPIVGISCESCHGPGSGYLETHDDKVEGAQAEAARRQASIDLGLRDVYDSPDQWAPLCFGCHVVSAAGGKLTAAEAEQLLRAGHPSGRDFQLEDKWTYVYGEDPASGVRKHWQETYSSAAVETAWEPLLAGLPPVPGRRAEAPPEEPREDPADDRREAPRDAPREEPARAAPRGSADVERMEGEISALRAEIRRLRRLLESPGTPPPAVDGTEYTPPPAAGADPLPRTEVGAVAAVQGQLIQLLTELLERNARTPIRVTPPEEELEYSGPDAALIRLQQETIRIAIRALGIDPRPAEEDSDDDSG